MKKMPSFSNFTKIGVSAYCFSKKNVTKMSLLIFEERTSGIVIFSLQGHCQGFFASIQAEPLQHNSIHCALFQGAEFTRSFLLVPFVLLSRSFFICFINYTVRQLCLSYVVYLLLFPHVVSVSLIWPFEFCAHPISERELHYCVQYTLSLHDNGSVYQWYRQGRRYPDDNYTLAIQRLLAP